MTAMLALVVAAMLQAPDAVKTIDKGDSSSVDSSRQVVVRTEAEWTKLWTEHGGDRKKPAVNFSTDMVVGVFMGSRNTAGYGVTVVSAGEKDGKMVVRYQETLPARGAITAQIITSPYHLVSVPKTAGSVTFEKAQTEK